MGWCREPLPSRYLGQHAREAQWRQHRTFPSEGPNPNPNPYYNWRRSGVITVASLSRSITNHPNPKPKPKPNPNPNPNSLSRSITNHKELAAVGVLGLMGRASRVGEQEVQLTALRSLDSFSGSAELRPQVCASLEGIAKSFGVAESPHSRRCLNFFLRLACKLMTYARASFTSDLSCLRATLGNNL